MKDARGGRFLNPTGSRGHPMPGMSGAPMVVRIQTAAHFLLILVFYSLLDGAVLPPRLAAQSSPLAAGSSQAAPADDSIPLGDHTGAKRVPARSGDICIQCGHAIGMQDPVYVVNGHRMPLHQRELEGDLPGQLRRLAAQFEPTGAFLQAAARQTGLSPFWFLFGCYVLLGLVCAALCAHRALHKGLPAWVWFLAGLFFNVAAFLAVLLRRGRASVSPGGVPPGLHKISSTHAPVACAKCGDWNHPSARRCVACGASLSPALESEVARSGLRPA
ncbi:MAG TPA: hypothetical protein VGR03_09835 [Candidatus Acidoferrum sp.]|nr:hypothetical protein [Candidatus Acidoferrum sp.]